MYRDLHVRSVNLGLFGHGLAEAKRQSSVAGFQNPAQNWPPAPSGQTAVLGPKLGSGTAGKTVVLGGWPQNQL